VCRYACGYERACDRATVSDELSEFLLIFVFNRLQKEGGYSIGCVYMLLLSLSSDYSGRMQPI
jgi:hypothetical protein